MAQRRTHRKSKLGCQECKRRHIKCDEARPACANCTTTERTCVYVAPRLRRAQATPNPAATEAGVTSAANSPGSVLLPPSASNVSASPSSLAASPFPTPSSSFQYGKSTSVNVRHMELLSNFLLETGPGLDSSRAAWTNLVHTTMPVVLSAPYVMLQALALSALHLSQSRPEQADSYQVDATSLQIEALTLLDEHLGQISSENCEAMLMFASLLGIHSLAEAVMRSKDDEDEFLDRFVTYLDLHRGVQTVTSQAWGMLLQSNMGGVLQGASEWLDGVAGRAAGRATVIEEDLNRLLDNSDMGSDSIEACRDAVGRLKMLYQSEELVEVQSDATAAPGLVWAWPASVSGTYTGLVQRRQPEALIILCYFAVLLHWRRGLWCVGCAGRLVIGAVSRALGSYWRRWLAWPNEVVEVL